jgi:ABC-type methionine transport system ATPase subunit
MCFQAFILSNGTILYEQPLLEVLLQPNKEHIQKMLKIHNQSLFLHIKVKVLYRK